ncbi:MAG: response regulator [Bacteroidetes bacterium]|nr:response regulator [Bacteroidota bacterium]
MKILVIEGEEIILKSITKALKSGANAEYAVTTANTALDGLRLIRNSTFDAIFVDAALAGLNSAEVLRRIKNTSPSVSVILMSGYLSGISFPDEASRDVDGFLSKPFTTDEIRSLVSRILVERNGQ